jgi:DNA-directed RNA polymerase III subunit RPC3
VARALQVLLEKKYLEQAQLSELAMMSLKETRERLYQMYRDELVSFQEVPRRADHHPSQTFYLWTMDLPQVSSTARQGPISSEEPCQADSSS